MATLVYSDVDGVDRSFALGHEPVTVGRDPACAIRSNDPRVSRHHARFFVDQGALWIEDLGSSNGIFVGPNKVQRAPVPTGEIILVGSLMIRLLPASGTLPPPMGLHGTLATWLDLERKTRVTVEEERDAFARRVGELHQQIATIKQSSDTLRPDNAGTSSNGTPLDAEAIRLRDEAEAKAAMLERTLAAVQSELDSLRGMDREAERPTPVGGELEDLRAKVATLESDLARRQSSLDDLESARSITEHAHAEVSREAQQLRDELVLLRRTTTAEIDQAKLDAAKSREKGMAAETAVGLAAAEKLAEADIVITRLEREVEQLKAAAVVATAPGEAKAQAANDQVVTLAAKVEKLEKELSASQIRAQGAERNLSGANAQVAKAEMRAAQLEGKTAEAEERIKTAEHDVAKALERVAQLETRLGAGDAPLQAAETRAAKIATELTDMTAQFEQRRDRVVALEKELFAAGEATKAAAATSTAAKDDVAKAQGKQAEAEARLKELSAKLDALASADSAIATATKTRDESVAKAQAAERRATEAERRAADAEQRGSAADTMAKAMAKDVAEALRRAADADTRAKGQVRDLAEAQKRAADAEARMGESNALIEAAEAKATANAERAKEIEKDLTMRAQQIQKDLGEKLAATQKDLSAQLAAAQKELGAKLESTQRELAAERSGLLALVDRKTQLERELADAKSQLPQVQLKLQEAEAKLAEAAVQIDTLQERVTDLESGMAVSETASQASLEDSRARVHELEKQLAGASVLKTGAESRVAALETRATELDTQLRAALDAQAIAEAALRDAHLHIEELVRTGEDRVSLMQAEAARLADAVAHAQDEAARLSDALAQAQDVERQLEARAETADIATVRVAALQRQLDDAHTQLADVHAQLADAHAKLASMEERALSAEQRAEAAMEEVDEARTHISAMGRASSQNDGAEQRAVAAEQKVAQMQARIVALQKEVDAAENVRSFAAETEREIAQFQRDLKEARANLVKMTLERDRFESELRDARGDEENTKNRTLPVAKGYDPDATAQADMAKLELYEKIKRLEKQDGDLRAQLADTEARLRSAMDGGDDGDVESTRTGSQLPIAVAEHVSVIEESVESLRAEMRAASDTAMDLDQTPEITAISDAVSNAAEHIERARTAIRALQTVIGMS